MFLAAAASFFLGVVGVFCVAASCFFPVFHRGRYEVIQLFQFWVWGQEGTGVSCFVETAYYTATKECVREAFITGLLGLTVFSAMIFRGSVNCLICLSPIFTLLALIFTVAASSILGVAYMDGYCTGTKRDRDTTPTPLRNEEYDPAPGCYFMGAAGLAFLGNLLAQFFLLISWSRFLGEMCRHMEEL